MKRKKYFIPYELSTRVAKRRKEQRIEMLKEWAGVVCIFCVATTILICAFL